MSVAVNRDGLHVLLWHRRGPNDTLRIEQSRLAEEIQVTKHTMNRVIGRMVDEGRIKPALGARRGKTSTYVVIDPAVWTPPAET